MPTPLFDEPDFPAPPISKLIQRGISWRPAYASLAAKLGVSVNWRGPGNVPTLGTVNSARAAWDAAQPADGTGTQFRLGQVPGTVLPDISTTGQPLDVLAGQAAVFPTDSYDYAVAITACLLRWQMYGTLLALTVSKAITFGEHGGRPEDQ